MMLLYLSRLSGLLHLRFCLSYCIRLIDSLQHERPCKRIYQAFAHELTSFLTFFD
jgi:hypothetical protein